MNAPNKIGKYTISKILGRGAMGIVYEGFDPDIERRVAVKTLVPSALDSELIAEFHARFKIEAKAAARCMHPNIVTILEYGDLDGMPFMVMEYIQGQSLTEFLRLGTPLKFNRLIKIFSQILKGLHFAHQSGVIHRDIKPSNVMIMSNDTIKITDFGIARLPVSSVTQTGYSVGTPNYMAPEQEAGSNVDVRADLFAVTVIFMELLDKVFVSDKIQHATLSPKGIYITPKINMNQSIPKPLIGVIQKGLAFNPNERFASAQQFASTLRKAVNTLRQEATGLVDSTNTTRTSIAGKNTQNHPHNLSEMEQQLVDLIGPIGSSLIEIYADQTSGPEELAEKVSEEIPSEIDRKAFLSHWSDASQRQQSRTQNQGLARTVLHKPRTPNKTVLSTPQSSVHGKFRLEQHKYSQVEHLLAQYVGPMAEILLDECLDSSGNYNEFVENLLESIPNEREKTDFRLKVKNTVF